MAISAERAQEIAKSKLSATPKLYETEDLYVAVPSGRQRPNPGDNQTYAIDKRTGKVSEVLLPSDEGFRILDTMRPVRKTRPTARKKKR